MHMHSHRRGIILASASPRRTELIKAITRDCAVIPADIDETVPAGLPVSLHAEYTARRKAAAVAADNPDALVIGCDTVVIIDGEPLGKPCDAAEASRMLRRLSGRVHTVMTGCCLIAGGRERCFSESTQVEFWNLSDAEIERYVSSGDPMDKAGAYGIQNEGALLVKGICGDFYNVMGLPLSRLKREIESFEKDRGKCSCGCS